MVGSRGRSSSVPWVGSIGVLNRTAALCRSERVRLKQATPIFQASNQHSCSLCISAPCKKSSPTLPGAAPVAQGVRTCISCYLPSLSQNYLLAPFLLIRITQTPTCGVNSVSQRCYLGVQDRYLSPHAPNCLALCKRNVGPCMADRSFTQAHLTNGLQSEISPI